jgi:lysophospholipase L1-like esterase
MAYPNVSGTNPGPNTSAQPAQIAPISVTADSVGAPTGALVANNQSIGITGAQLAALVTGGGSTLTSAQASSTINLQKFRKRKIAFTGDSTFASNEYPFSCNAGGYYDSMVTAASVGGGSNLWAVCVHFVGADRMTPTGTGGTLKYTKTTNALQWKASGDTGYGAGVALDRAKFCRIESATTGYGIWVYCRPNTAGATAAGTNQVPSSDCTDVTLNIGTNGANYNPVTEHMPSAFTGALKGALGTRYQAIGSWAFSGNWTQNIIDMLPDIITAAPDEVVVLVGTNDASSATALSVTTANYTSIATTLNAAGIFCRFVSLLPRGAATDTLVILAAKDALNAWLSAYTSGQRMMSFHDISSSNRVAATYSATFPNADTLSTVYKADKLHLNPLGASTDAVALAAQILDSQAPLRYESPYDLYNASTNPYGNIVTNPQMIVGSSRVGTAAGANINGNTTGTPPDDWTAWSAGAGTSSCIVEARTVRDATDLTPGQWWKITHGAGAGMIQYYIALPVANFVAGDLIECTFDIAVDNPSLFTRLDSRVEFSNYDRIGIGQAVGAVDVSIMGTDTTTLRRTVTSPIWRVPSTWTWNAFSATPSLCRLNVYATSTSGTLYLGNFSVRKIRTP